MILPGKTIGILGGGQLGRMLAIAARRMGYRVATFDPTCDCPAGQVADLEINAPYDDLDAARRFAQRADIVTFEFENVPAETLAAIEKLRPVQPSPFVLQTTRNRLLEKRFLQQHGFPVADFQEVRSLSDLGAAVAALGVPCVLKTAAFGYDGKGQVRIDSPDNLDAIWRQWCGESAAPVGVVERFIRFEREISLIVALTASGQLRCFDVFENEHRRHILDTTIVPADIPPELAGKATELAAGIARRIGLVGLLCVEMFVEADGSLIVNELAPRPHNSGHVTVDAAVTSQFEQHLRAVCGLPLGETALFKPAAMANLLGDLWQHKEPDWSAALADPRVKLHLYGKHQARPGRKMGHLTAVADSTREARQIVVEARRRLIEA
ncbi:MAG: 5-(carboxyamino)imidazole ribonucleotide synthase [Phycisphaerae bacterium]|nr:5-(carboxyamino)imidazole ribonucleotide synthase [Phycisphaerae bacterium]MDW8261303.1 5-(carboxyamino)imidazole ribonucleotide synthase [Phycisphaerales bacterium]